MHSELYQVFTIDAIRIAAERAFVQRRVSDRDWVRSLRGLLMAGAQPKGKLCTIDFSGRSRALTDANVHGWVLVTPDIISWALRENLVVANAARYSDFIPIYITKTLDLVGFNLKGSILVKRACYSIEEEEKRERLRKVEKWYSPWICPWSGNR